MSRAEVCERTTCQDQVIYQLIQKGTMSKLALTAHWHYIRCLQVPVRGLSYDLRPPFSSGLLRHTYIYISPLSFHLYTYYYSLSTATSPTFGDVAVHIPLPISSFHIVPFPFSMIPYPSQTCPRVSQYIFTLSTPVKGFPTLFSWDSP